MAGTKGVSYRGGRRAYYCRPKPPSADVQSRGGGAVGRSGEPRGGFGKESDLV